MDRPLRVQWEKKRDPQGRVKLDKMDRPVKVKWDFKKKGIHQ